jgi:hypothetical protein
MYPPPIGLLPRSVGFIAKKSSTALFFRIARKPIGRRKIALSAFLRLQLPAASNIEESPAEIQIAGSIRHLTQLQDFFPPPRCRGYLCFRGHDFFRAVGSARRSKLWKHALHVSAPLPKVQAGARPPLAAMGKSCLGR